MESAPAMKNGDVNEISLLNADINQVDTYVEGFIEAEAQQYQN